MKLQTLYKKSSLGKIQEWTISTNGNTIITRWGVAGGKIQETSEVIKEGKNLGRSNATTPEEQADLEATSQFEQKLKKGYVRTLKDASAGKTDKIIEGGIFPMLAKVYSDQADKVVWPAFCQPKLDGHRCIAIVKKGVCTLWSRTRKPINSVPHINRELERVFGDDDTELDGELYNHSYRNKFEELTSFIRQEDPKPGHEIIQYHVYDVVDYTSPFSDRAEYLQLFKPKFDNAIVNVVETLKIDDEDDLMLAFENFTKQGFEGAMVRNSAGMYVNKRTSDLLKVKEFQDFEAEIVRIEEGRGKLAGHAIFICITEAGDEFKAKMKGDSDKLKWYFNNPEKVIGKQLTVQYQGMTKSKVPRFPVGLRFREDI